GAGNAPRSASPAEGRRRAGAAPRPAPGGPGTAPSGPVQGDGGGPVPRLGTPAGGPAAGPGEAGPPLRPAGQAEAGRDRQRRPAAAGHPLSPVPGGGGRGAAHRPGTAADPVTGI